MPPAMVITKKILIELFAVYSCCILIKPLNKKIVLNQKSNLLHNTSCKLIVTYLSDVNSLFFFWYN